MHTTTYTHRVWYIDGNNKNKTYEHEETIFNIAQTFLFSTIRTRRVPSTMLQVPGATSLLADRGRRGGRGLAGTHHQDDPKSGDACIRERVGMRVCECPLLGKGQYGQAGSVH